MFHPKRRSSAAAWLVLAVTLLAGCGASIPPSMPHPLHGGAAPSISGTATDTRSVVVPSSTGRGRVVVIDFWASWCSLCRQTLPAFDALYRERRHEGLDVVGVSIDESERAATGFMDSIGGSFPVVMDGRQRFARAYGVRALPLTFVVDRQGQVRWVGRDPERARSAAESLLRE